MLTLVPIDLADESANQLATLGAMLTQMLGGETLLLYVSDPPFIFEAEEHPMPELSGVETEHLGEDTAIARLKELADELPGTVKWRFVEGEPREMTLDMARECGADLIIIGTHRRTGLERVLGSVATGVVRAAEIPVLTIPPEGLSKSAKSIDRILLVTDFSRPANEAARESVRWAKALNAPVTVLHCLDKPSTYQYDPISAAYPPITHANAFATRMQQKAVDVVADLRREGVSAEHAIMKGPAAEHATAMAEEIDAGLIIVGTRGHGAVKRVLLGSQSQRLLRWTQRPVLVVPAPAD